MEDFPVIKLVIVALNNLGSFGNHFFRRIKMLFTSIGRSVLKNCALCLEYRPRLRPRPVSKILGAVLPYEDLPAGK